MRVRGLYSLGVSQALTLLVAVASGAVYARWLDAPTLAGWALALAAARAGQLVLDAGLKTALVRRETSLAMAHERRIQAFIGSAAAALVLLTAGGLELVRWTGWADLPAPGFLLFSVATYLLSYALLLPSLVRLERAGRFDHVGRAEAAGTLLEFGAPALLLMAGVSAVPALGVGVCAGRFVRAALLMIPAQDPATVAEGPGVTLRGTALHRDGLLLQAAGLLSMARDTLHLWLVGPWFGAAWAGAYAFAMMACMIASQALVALAARVALPALRPLTPQARLETVVRALRLLALLVVPPLILLALLPTLQSTMGMSWPGEQWHDALALLPALVLRVLLTLPLALFAPWLLVVAEPAQSLRVHGRWTLVEAGAAAAALAWIGPQGLAWVWPAGGALGLWLYVRALRHSGVSLVLLPSMLLRGPRQLRWEH